MRIALIIVSRETVGAALRATLTVAGRTLVEHQAWRAIGAGATELMLVAERVTPALSRAVERLRDGGMVVQVALAATDAAARLPPGAGLLLLADGVLPASEALEQAHGSEALLILPDEAGEAWERIDATSRWAGVALLDGASLAATAAMLGEWDLELTLVRGLVGRARRVAVAPRLVRQVRDEADAAALGAELAAAMVAPGVIGSIERRLLGWTIDRGLSALWLRRAALTGAAVGAVGAGAGPLWLALPALLAAGPLDRLGRTLGRLRMERDALGEGWSRARHGMLAAALPAFGWRLSGDAGHEPLLLAFAALAFTLAAGNEARLVGVEPERWSARAEPMLWLGAAFAALGQGAAGLLVLSLWSAASLFRLQQRALNYPSRRRPAADQAGSTGS